METILNSEYVSIGELVRLTETRYSTLKFYTEEGILPFVQEDTNLKRRFERISSVKRIEDIKQMRKDGLSIPQIKEKYKV